MPAGDARVTASTAPSKSVSGELLAYPKNLLQSPSDVTSATASFEPGTSAGPIPQLPSRSALASAGHRAHASRRRVREPRRAP